MALFQQQDMDADDALDEGTDKASDAVPTTLGDPIATFAMGSILYSWYKFYAQEDKLGGIFVGLWAPTLFAAATYLQQKDLIGRFKRGLSSL